MPASLRKMLQLKAAAEGQKADRAAAHHTSRETTLASLVLDNKATDTVPLQHAQKIDQQRDEEEPPKKRRRQMPETKSAPAKPTLKSRKKDFLKKKKLRKKGKMAPQAEDDEDDDESDDSDPEDRIRKIAASTRPKFLESSNQPLQVHLKRKNWTEADEKNKKVDRMKNIMMKQLANSGKAAAEATRLEAIDAYRRQKKGGDYAPATLKSLAALVRKDPVAKR